MIVSTVDGRTWDMDLEEERRAATEAARRWFASEKRQPAPGEPANFIRNWLAAAKVYGPRRADYSRPPDVQQMELLS